MKIAAYLRLGLATLVACACLGWTSGAWAQSSEAPAGSASPASQKQLDIAAARAERKALVGQNMNLSQDEAKKFWPLYEEYEGGMDRIEDRHIREIKDFAKNYQTLTDTDAKSKLDEVMRIAEARLALQKQSIPKFRAILPEVKVTRFFQIDNKLRAMVQCQIAQMVPLAHSPGEATAQ